MTPSALAAKAVEGDLVNRLRELWSKYWAEALDMDEVEATLEEAAARILALEAFEHSAFQRGAEEMREMAAKCAEAETLTGIPPIHWTVEQIAVVEGTTKATSNSIAAAIRAIHIPAPDGREWFNNEGKNNAD